MVEMTRGQLKAKALTAVLLAAAALLASSAQAKITATPRKPKAAKAHKQSGRSSLMQSGMEAFERHDFGTAIAFFGKAARAA